VPIINRFYMIKDGGTGETYDASSPPTFGGLTEADLFDATDDVVQSTNTTTAQTALNALNSAKGWYITLLGLGSGSTSPGEKTVGAPTTAAGVVYFGTNQPSPETASNVCRPLLGIARLYAIDLVTAGAITNYFVPGTPSAIGRFTTVAGGGFPPSPVPLAVKIGGNRREGVISGTKVLTTATGVGDRLRSFIRIIHDKRTPN
jgi:type IV pilus assembly protein PilY1